MAKKACKEEPTFSNEHKVKICVRMELQSRQLRHHPEARAPLSSESLRDVRSRKPGHPKEPGRPTELLRWAFHPSQMLDGLQLARWLLLI